MSIKSKCPACRKLVKGSCERCKKSKLKSQKSRRIRLIRNNLCTSCANPTNSNKTRCEICRNKEKRIIKTGDCTKCGANRNDKEFIIRKNLCRDCAAEQSKKYRIENPQKNAEKHRKYFQANFKNWLRVVLISIRASSKRKKLEFTIDLNNVLHVFQKQNKLCALTGIPLTHITKDLRSASIDRIDSNKGYIIGNVQIVCKAINLAKNTHSNQEMIDFINEIKR